jgi:hypothetical protein
MGSDSVTVTLGPVAADVFGIGAAVQVGELEMLESSCKGETWP